MNFLVRFLFSNQLCRFSSLDSKVEKAEKWIKSLCGHIMNQFKKKNSAHGLPGHCPLRKVVAWAQMGIAH